MFIDIHSHIFNEKNYQSYLKRTKGLNPKIIVIDWYKNDRDIGDLLKFTDTKDNLYVVGAIDMDKDMNEQIKVHQKLFEEKKIYGIKLAPGYQYFYPSDEKVYPIAELCQKYNKPLIFHSGDVYDPDGMAIMDYTRPIHIDKLAVKFNRCKIIIAHFGFPYHLETASIVSKNENVYTDISGTLDEVDTEREANNMLSQYIMDLKRVFNYYPDIKKKVMFGTDYSGEDSPLNNVESYIEVVKSVFSKEEQESIFSELADKLFFK